MMTGSSSGWLMLAGMMARPRAISLRTNSGVMNSGISAPKSSPSARRSAAPCQRLLPAEVLAVRDVDHFFGDDAGAGEFVLRDQLARLAAQHAMLGRAGRHQAVADAPPLSSCFTARGAMRSKPRFAIHSARSGGRPASRSMVTAGIGVRAGGVVGAIRLLARRGLQRDFAERHGDVGTAGGRGVDLAGAGDRAGGDAARAGGGLRLDGHGRLLNRTHGPCGRRTGDCDRGGTRPYAGMTRFRFKGYRAAALDAGGGGISAPCGGAPLGSPVTCGGSGAVSNR